jgi:hypothetical protein
MWAMQILKYCAYKVKLLQKLKLFSRLTWRTASCVALDFNYPSSTVFVTLYSILVCRLSKIKQPKT